MAKYQLVFTDQMENSVLRRRLRPWADHDANRVRCLVDAILDAHACSEYKQDQFRWDTHVYPLFYYGWRRGDRETAVYEKIRGWFESYFPAMKNLFDENGLQQFVRSVANAEIDLLIESPRYFIFVEAKIPPHDRPATFQRTGGTHQLVRQMVQAALLSKIVDKKWMLATLGADHEQSFLKWNQVLDAVSIENTRVPNFSWDLLPITDEPQIAPGAE